MVTTGVDVLTLASVHEAFGRWLAFPTTAAGDPDYDVIDVALAVIIANRVDDDPLWMFIINPSSSAKTEVLRSLEGAPDTYALSSLTPNTLLSGFELKGDADASLLPQLNGKTILFKDFTTVLSLNREARSAILSQFREVYDGAMVRTIGTGKRLAWEGKVGLLGGCTGVVDTGTALNGHLGERFLLFRPAIPNERAVSQQALAQQRTHQKQARLEIRDLVSGFLATLLPATPPMPDAVAEGIGALARFVARGRRSILSDYHGEINLILDPEGPGRLTKQLALLARAVAIVRAHREVNERDYLTVIKVAFDCLPAPRRRMIDVLSRLAASGDATPSTTTVSEATRYPTSTTRRYLAELHAAGFVDRAAGGQGRADNWTLADEYHATLAAVWSPISTTTTPDAETTCSVASGRV
jgi:hypothetical protein